MPHSISKPIPQLSVQEAAAQVVALINATPRTPWPSEIEAIVARVVSSPDPAPASPRTAEWRRVLAEERAGHEARMQEHRRRKALGEDATEEDLDKIADIEALMDRTQETTLAIWRTGAKTWADVVLFAEVARYWKWDPEEPELDQNFKVALELDDARLDEQSLAQLVNAVLQLGGAQS